MDGSLKRLSKKTNTYILALVIVVGAVSFGVASFASANASLAYTHSARAKSLYSKLISNSKPKLTAVNVADKTTDSTVSPTVKSSALSKPINKSASATNVGLNSSSIVSSKPTVKISTTTPSVSPTTSTPPATPASSEEGVYDGNGYHVQDTQITETISRTSAQVCAGYLCGDEGPTISYNLSSPAAGGFQFVESRSDNVEFYIYSGGLSKGDSPAFSPVSINPNVPDGTYTGSIQLQLNTDANDDYVNGPVIGYTIYLTD